MEGETKIAMSWEPGLSRTSSSIGKSANFKKLFMMKSTCRSQWLRRSKASKIVDSRTYRDIGLELHCAVLCRWTLRQGDRRRKAATKCRKGVIVSEDSSEF